MGEGKGYERSAPGVWGMASEVNLVDAATLWAEYCDGQVAYFEAQGEVAAALAWSDMATKTRAAISEAKGN